MRIYILEGQTGEYDDRQEWSVKAFKSKESAENYREAIHKSLPKVFSIDENGHIRNLERRYEYNKNPLDPNFRVCYPFTRYIIYELELED